MIPECVHRIEKSLKSVKDNGKSDIALVSLHQSGCKRSAEILMKRHYGSIVMAFMSVPKTNLPYHITVDDIFCHSLASVDRCLTLYKLDCGVPLRTHIYRNVELRTRGYVRSIRRSHEIHEKGEITKVTSCSMFTPIEVGTNNGTMTLEDTFGYSVDMIGDIFRNRNVGTMLELMDEKTGILSEREWFVVELIKSEETTSEIAKLMNISSERVRQLKTTAFDKLRIAMTRRGITTSHVDSHVPVCRHH